MNGFFREVYGLVRRVPRGRVITYGAVARALGEPRAARRVGWALYACGKVEPPVPAHRVVDREGRLSGEVHFGGPGRMARRLCSEGVRVKNGRVLDFDRLFWEPPFERKRKGSPT